MSNPTTEEADAGALAVLLDLIDEVLPKFAPFDRAPFERAADRARRLRTRLLAGEVLVLTEADA